MGESGSSKYEEEEPGKYFVFVIVAMAAVLGAIWMVITQFMPQILPYVILGGL